MRGLLGLRDSACQTTAPDVLGARGASVPSTPRERRTGRAVPCRARALRLGDGGGTVRGGFWLPLPARRGAMPGSLALLRATPLPCAPALGSFVRPAALTTLTSLFSAAASLPEYPMGSVQSRASHLSSSLMSVDAPAGSLDLILASAHTPASGHAHLLSAFSSWFRSLAALPSTAQSLSSLQRRLTPFRTLQPDLCYSVNCFLD